MRLQQIKDKAFFVVLPRQLVRAKGWIKGEELDCKIDAQGNLVIKKQA